MLDHKILIDKLYPYGIRGIPLDWFISYLENRWQYVKIGDNTSSKVYTTCGVPQGSMLGSLLFILYINDIVNVSDVAKLIMFADDTNIFLCSDSLKGLECLAKNELTKFANWFKLNKLSLNIKETNYILFYSKQNEIKVNLKIKIDNIEIDKSKFLGVIINENLTWEDHIALVKAKVSKNIGVIQKIRNNLPRNTLQLLYYTLIHPYVNYCNIIWACQDNVHLRVYIDYKNKKFVW